MEKGKNNILIQLDPQQKNTTTKNIVLTQIALVLLGTALIMLGTQINIPLQPVAVTLQTFAVLFISMLYGVRLSVLAVLIYLAAALAGLPVITGDIKLNAGYLAGFLLAAGLTGFLAERGWARHFFSALTAALLGSIVILICGWSVLFHFLDASIAFDVGVQPFLLGGVVKIILLAFIVPGFWRLMEKKSPLLTGEG